VHLVGVGRVARDKFTSGSAFERKVHETLEKYLPFSVLPNVALFRSDQFRAEDPSPERSRINSRAYEIDNVFHYRSNERDHIVIVEAKAPKISVADDKWLYSRQDQRRRDACNQLISHAETVLQYLRPLGAQTDLTIDAFVVPTSYEPAGTHTKKVDDHITLHLCSLRDLARHIRDIKQNASDDEANVQVLRVAQSEFMTLLRLGVPLRSLGHPELGNAIRYVARCRRDIDHELYRSFTPSKGRWAINGTAGMGKSVLLAYATAVFSSDRRLEFRSSSAQLADFAPRATEIGLNELAERYICVYAMKPKQRDVLEREYLRLFQEFSIAAGTEELRFIKPHFDVWKDERAIPAKCSVLVIDESHDLSEKGQDMVRAWFEGSATNYLMLACDRHQKIRLGNRNATLVNGFSFSGHAKRLARNYRNPFAVNAASLGLMYRWFADDGVKVIPTKAEFNSLLGFEVTTQENSEGWRVSMKDDSHPGNLWSHCVSSFPSCNAAYEHLAQQNLSSSDVLWVRFSEEDSDFDYEQLSRYTYHNFHTPESAALVDKYVKGQEAPIVVIEGFPDVIDEGGIIQDGTSSEQEGAMWSFRRQVYICSSRATAFLYFVFNVPETESAKRFERELNQLLLSLSAGDNVGTSGSKTWSFYVRNGSAIRRPTIFDDMDDETALGEVDSTSKTDIRRQRSKSTRRARKPRKPAPQAVPQSGRPDDQTPSDKTAVVKTERKDTRVGPEHTVKLRYPIVVRSLARALGNL